MSHCRISRRHGVLCHRRGQHVGSHRYLLRHRRRLPPSLTLLSGGTSLKAGQTRSRFLHLEFLHRLNGSPLLSSLVRILGRATRERILFRGVIFFLPLALTACSDGSVGLVWSDSSAKRKKKSIDESAIAKDGEREDQEKKDPKQ